MEKQLRNRKIKIIGALVLIFMLLAAAVVPVALMAAQTVNLTGGGELNFELEDPTVPSVPDHDESSIQNQIKELAGEGWNSPGCGFAATAGEDGGITLSSGGVGSDTKTVRENLISCGILSYAKYENALCENLNNLIIILDFTEYYITNIQSNFLQGVAVPILGDYYNSGYKPVAEVPVYDSAQGGTQVRTALATFGERKIIVVDNGETTELTDGGLSLRIVLPNLGAESTITLANYSLNCYEWGYDYGGSTNGTAGSLTPENISIDISNTQIQANTTTVDGVETTTFTGLSLAQNLTQHNYAGSGDANIGSCKHLHFIAKSAAQLEYSLDTAVTRSQNNSAESWEIYIKETPSTAAEQTATKYIYTQIYAKVLQESGKTRIDIIDSTVKDTTTDVDIIAVLETAYWLHFRKGIALADINAAYALKHVHRTSENKLGASAVLTINTTPETINGVSVYSVTCAHTGEGQILGYFGAGRVYFNSGKETLSVT